jgi:hypothetical protein
MRALIKTIDDLMTITSVGSFSIFGWATFAKQSQSRYTRLKVDIIFGLTLINNSKIKTLSIATTFWKRNNEGRLVAFPSPARFGSSLDAYF